MQKIGVIGAGAWGTALAQSLANAGKDIILWAREKEVADSISQQHENKLFLPGVRLNEMIKATDNLDDVNECDIFLIVTPAQHIRTTLESMKNALSGGKPYLICAKGIELKSGKLLSDVAKEVLPGSTLGFLTGPTFAKEIARGLPCAVTVAMENTQRGEEVIAAIGSRTLRTYLTNDIIGAQIGGAVKNVLAIASGVIHGRKMGESARCALVTRGLTEMGRLASALGAKKETLMGMCGVGDLILTCSSMQSRNYSLGVALGEGKTLEEVLGDRVSVTEGVHTAKALKIMAEKNAVDMPISYAVSEFLEHDADIGDIIERVLDRPLRQELI